MKNKFFYGILIALAAIALTAAGTLFMYRALAGIFYSGWVKYADNGGAGTGAGGSDIASAGGNSAASSDKAYSYNKGTPNKNDAEPIDNASPDDSGQTMSDEEKRELFNSKLDTIMDYIDYYYYNEIDDDVIYDSMLHAALDALGDPYSVYYSPEEFDALLEASSGTYSGIGATVTQNLETGAISIVKPFVGSPAAASGLLPGDLIIKVNDQDTYGMDLTSVVAMLKGPAGTSIEVTILRDEEEIAVSITRQTINVEFVSHRMLEGDIGYIMISEFEETTADQFDAAINDLTDKGMKGLVVDLRDNPGGLYNICVEMLDRIAPKGSLLVYTEDKYGTKERRYAKNSEKLSVPLVVLVNGNSASASEIFAGAVQDLNLGIIMGTQSFGKGIVQSVIPIMDDLSGIKVTSSRYFTPGGVCIHGVGITPDKIVELDEDLKRTLIENRDHDNQIDAAVEFLKQ
ncbi:MAG: S41 family peptidase [Lachnospiraceae bacterium]|nr:S41 family peptidase [Lachnospiraceae bacterium]